MVTKCLVNILASTNTAVSRLGIFKGFEGRYYHEIRPKAAFMTSFRNGRKQETGLLRRSMIPFLASRRMGSYNAIRQSLARNLRVKVLKLVHDNCS